jgi:AraC family transcriptional activator of tynA and feaB
LKKLSSRATFAANLARADQKRQPQSSPNQAKRQGRLLLKTVFNLLEAEPKHRVDLWKTKLGETFAPVELTNYNVENFDVRMETSLFGDLEISTLIGAEQGICRPRRLIRPSDTDTFVAVVQMGGSRSYTHGGNEATGLGESVTLFDMTQDYRTMMRGSLDIINITVPRKRIEAMFGSTRHLAGMSLDVGQPLTQLIIEFFRTQMQIADQLSAETASRLGAIGSDLLATAVLETIGRIPGYGVSGTAAVVRAKAFIRGRIGDELLSPMMVAASQKLSLRRMQELFAAESLSISDYIWEQRLLRSKMMLEGKARIRVSIANVAYAVGFASLPHFSRRFRARFGCSPAEAQRFVAKQSEL